MLDAHPPSREDPGRDSCKRLPACQWLASEVSPTMLSSRRSQGTQYFFGVQPHDPREDWHPLPLHIPSGVFGGISCSCAEAKGDRNCFRAPFVSGERRL